MKVSWKNNDYHTPKHVCTGKIPGLTGYLKIRCHIVFDAKKDFKRKEKIVAGKHTTEASTFFTCSIIV